MKTTKNITIISILLLILLIAIGIAIALGNVRKQNGSSQLGFGLVHNLVALDQHLVPEAAMLHTSLLRERTLEEFSPSASWGTVSQSPLPGSLSRKVVHWELADDKLELLQVHA